MLTSYLKIWHCHNYSWRSWDFSVIRLSALIEKVTNPIRTMRSMCKNRTWHVPIQNTHKDQQRSRSRIVNLYQQNLKTNFIMFCNEGTVINIRTTQKLFKSSSDLNVTEWKYVPFIECLYQIGTSDIFNVTQTVPGINPILRLKDWDSERPYS